MVNLDEPPFLAVGTEVSAKYKGAFCEAKINKICKTVKCKVQYSNGISAFVTDDAVIGQLKVGATVDIKCDNKKELVPAKIKKIQDCSQYTVVFNDGDITCLKRTALCLKSERHFAAYATLDQLPLTHPEHIGVNSVRTTIAQVHRSRKRKKSSGESGKEEDSAMEENNFGKVVCVEANDKKKVRDNWFPGLIVAPTSQSSVRTNVAEDYLVRSFKDGKYYTTPKKEITEFTKEIGARVENPTLKTAVEKALLFLDKDELPPHWDRDLLFGVSKIYIAPDSVAFNSNNSDEESIEEKDHFVAQLFKFMDERGTPLNQAPVINEKDVDLYKLFKVVNNCGGYNKVNKSKLWKFVANKAGHEQQSFFSVKHCYQQYLHSFEDFHRKLGCTMLSHPRGVRSRNKFSRSIIRDIDKALPSTSSATEKNKCAKNELNNKKNKDSAVTKKTAKAIKAEEKLLKNNEETSKKDDKIKKDIVNSISCNELSVKWDPDLTETKDAVKNYKTKKEVKKEIDSGTVGDDQIIEDKKEEKKIFTKNLFGKSVQKTANKEKVVKVKSSKTGLPGMRKIRAIKEQIKTFVKEIIPLKKSKRGNSNTQQDELNKGNSIEEVPKLTRSRIKEDLPTKSRRVSVLNDLTGSASTVQLTQPGLLVENLIKIKKEDGSEKKKTPRKKKNDKEEKAALNNIIPPPIVEYVPFDENSTVIVGDNLVVYYGDKQETTYEAKVVNVCKFNEVMKYFVHYKGWNSRYDEWIDGRHIAFKKKEPEPGPELNNAAKSSVPEEPEPGPELENAAKSSVPEHNNLDPKNLPSTPNRNTKSITPLPSNSNIKISPFSSGRPTRSCTLTDRPLFDIDNSDSEEEYAAIVEPSKQYNKKKVVQSEPVAILKTDPLNTDNQKKMPHPKTYPSKEVLMHRSALRKQKSCVLNVHNTKSEEVKVCEPVILKPTSDFNFVMQLPNDSIKPNEDNENVETQNKSKIDNSLQIEPKIAPNCYLSTREKFERNYLKHVSESSKSGNEEIRIKSKPLTIPTTSEISSTVYCSSSSEDKEQNQFKKVTNVISSPLDDKSNESKISGTDFDLNKIRSEMKGLMPTSTNSYDIIQNTESLILDQQIDIEVSTINEAITDDVYEFKESETCNFNTISSVNEEKICRSIRHDSPKLLNFEKADELPRIIDSPAQEEVVEQNKSIIPFVPNSNSIYSFDNNVEIKVNENLNIKNNIENPIMKNQSDNESFETQTLMISDDVTVVTSSIKKIEQHFQDEDNVPDSKYEVLDLCMKPPDSPSTNIFSMPEQNELNDLIIEEDDDEDDDESKLVIAEHDKVESDYQMDSDLVISEEHNSSDGQIDKNIEAQSLPPLSNIHANIKLECKSSTQVKKDISISKDSDDESTTSYNESIETALIQSFQMYSNFKNHSSQNGLNIDNIDDSKKSDFDSNSKLPTIKNREIIESATKLVNEPLNNDKPKKCDFKVLNCKDKYEKEKPMVLPELQCTEEIVDEDTLNNTLVIEHSCKAAEYDIHKPSTSKSFFDSIHQPGTSKDSFYKTDTSYDAKNSYFEATQAVKSDTNGSGKSSIFDPNIPGCSNNYFYNHNVPSTSKSSFYENSLPSTSKSFYNPESDVSSVLFCEETIPGSPTGTLEEQYDQEERKKALQTLYEERDAASAMYAMNQSFCRPMITLMGATEEEMEEYTNILQKDGAILDQQHLQFLAEISSRNLGINLNEPSVTESLEKEPETIVEKIVVKPPEKIQSKRKISSHEKLSKRSKFSTNTNSTPSAIHVEKPYKDTWEIPQPPIVDGKPMFTYDENMTSAQRQALIIFHMDKLRVQHAEIKDDWAKDKKKRRKKKQKKKREKAKAAKAAKAATLKPSQTANGSNTSK